MSKSTLIEDAVAGVAQEIVDKFFERFEHIQAHVQQLWDAEKPKFDAEVAEDKAAGRYEFTIDLSEFPFLDKAQTEAVVESLPVFKGISHWVYVYPPANAEKPQEYQVSINYGYARKAAIKQGVEERMDKRRREEREVEREVEREAEREAVAKKARNEAAELIKEEEAFLAPAALCDKMPKEGQAILENALARIGYDVDPGRRGSLSEGWRRALRNEHINAASESFKDAMIEACEKCHQNVPAIVAATKAARAELSQ